MPKTQVELIASYWTIAGDTHPGAASEISPFTLQERAEAASKAGWRGMGLVHADILHSIERLGLPTVRNIFQDNGMKHLEVEFLIDWHLACERRTASDRMCEELLEIAAQVGARKLKCAAGLFEEGLDVGLMRESFAILCDKAMQYNVDVAIEFLPFSSVNTIDKALAVATDIRPNGGLMVDSWHIARGGMGFEEISKIPVELIKGVEVDDADLNLVGDVFNDSTHHRKCCGEGELEIPVFVQAILDTGYRGPWGVELISAELRKLPLDVIAKRAFETTMAQFENARF
ncbi:sugar phosphate isomerase/epimerase [Pseudomonas sp. R5(2019)]|uniref:sugar phosphate isomerase/epimerase family protein n=1 Tax=Pseudomonas sp. R5(2019) TaxID=2697566 RepID=UPI001411F991|nr:TIM barrel protein [Pseudomonas sp. R5(2019)]NBA95723.1 TIM barrel protein [Pseudomonas sp. R5(2019)]